MSALRIRLLPTALASGLLCALPASAQTFGPDFVADYVFTDLGTPSSIPSPLGGLNFDPADPNTLWIGGAANASGGALYSISLIRNAGGHITAFAGNVTFLATATDIDGGVAFGPTGVMFVTTFSSNNLLQYLPGSTSPDKTIDLTPLGINSSVGTCQFVPTGFAGAGTFKIGSYSSSDWYDVVLAPDGMGTFDIVSATQTVNTGGGPEGIVYIGGNNPGFTVDSVIISEYAADAVRVYDIDANGDPIPATQREFLSGLSGAEGAVIDPVTGDFLFSTFGGGNRVIVVEGFSAPSIFCNGTPNSLACTPTITWTGTPTLTGPDDFGVLGTGFLNEAYGALFFSLVPGNIPAGNATICLSGRSLVSVAQFSNGTVGAPGVDCTGSYGESLSQAWMAMAGSSGTVVYLQYLSRDGGSAPPNNISVSDGLRFTIQP